MAKKKRQQRRRTARVPLPDGNYAVVNHHTDPNGRRIRITAVHHREPDLSALAKVFIELADSDADGANNCS